MRIIFNLEMVIGLGFSWALWLVVELYRPLVEENHSVIRGGENQTSRVILGKNEAKPGFSPK